MKTFLYDMTLVTSLTVTAETPEQARAELFKTLDCADANFGSWSNGDPALGEVSLHDEPDLVEIDGEEVQEDEDKPLPPDPEDRNDDRADWAEIALQALMDKTGTDPENALSDLLCDLMHLCDRKRKLYGRFKTQLERAKRCYAEETEPFEVEEA